MTEKEPKKAKKSKKNVENTSEIAENTTLLPEKPAISGDSDALFAQFASAEAITTLPPPSPPDTLNKNSVEALEITKELSDLYKSAKDLLDDIITDALVPANQRAQVLNSVASLIQQISKTRTDLYTAERMRRLEQALIRTLKEFPRELQEKFMADYERSLAESDVS